MACMSIRADRYTESRTSNAVPADGEDSAEQVQPGHVQKADARGARGRHIGEAKMRQR